MAQTTSPPDPADPDGYDAAALDRARAAVNATPSNIGRYRVLERIGGGGMGEVYRAEQRTPVRREVAIKLIKLGMDTQLVIARFEAERQALAMMDHPHIAKVYDADADETGRPYFVMEYVKGRPITDYADANHLTIPERLTLFEQVCHAVQHAHHKGIIHRDLKPGNVLVSTQDGRPHAKVIDFGIAKATNQQLTDKTLFTQHDQFIGTPQYMSPEQADGSLDIDTRSDVYSLGVLLYELLTGSTPFSRADFKQVAIEQVKKMIRDVDPPKPSTRLSLSTQTLPSLAASRRVEPKKLGTMVRGELDWIVMKAMDKDRARRYDTPASLGEDLVNFRSGEPVVAAPPGWAYTSRKWVRKHRPLLAVSATLFGFLAIGILGTGIGFMRERAAKLDAVASENRARSAGRLAEERRVLAEQQHEQLELTSYGTKLKAAQQAVTAGELDVADAVLVSAPPARRGWEWRHLSAQCHPGLSETPIPSGMTVLAHSDDGTFALLNSTSEAIGPFALMRASDGQTVAQIRLPPFERVLAAAVASEGRRVAILVVNESAPARGLMSTLHVWDAQAGAIVWSQPSSPATTGDLFGYGEGGLSISADGRRVSVCGITADALKDHPAELDQGPIYDFATGTGTYVFDVDGNHRRRVLRLPNGGKLSEDGQTIHQSFPAPVVANIDAPEQTQIPLDGHYNGTRSSGDPKRVALWRTDGKSERWVLFDCEKRVQHDAPSTFAGRWNAIFYQGGGRALAVVNGVLTVLPTADDEAPVALGRTTAGVDAVCIDERGASVYVYDVSRITRYPLPSDAECQMLRARPTSGDLTPDGKYMLEKSNRRTVCHDSITLESLGITAELDGIAFSKDSRRVASIKGKTITVHALPDLSIVEQTECNLPDDMKPQRLTFSDSAEKLIAWCGKASYGSPSTLSAIVIDHGVVQETLRLEFPGRVGRQPTVLGWTGPRLWLKVGKTVRSCEVPGGALQAEAASVDAAAISPDGRRLAAVDGRSVTLFDLPGLAPIRSWQIPQSGNYELQWGDGGRRLFISSDKSSSTCVCDSMTGEILVTFPSTDSTKWVVPSASSAFVAAGEFHSGASPQAAWDNLRRISSQQFGPHEVAANRELWNSVRTPTQTAGFYAQCLTRAETAVKSSRFEHVIYDTYLLALYRCGQFNKVLEVADTAALIGSESRKTELPDVGQQINDEAIVGMALSRLHRDAEARQKLCWPVRTWRVPHGLSNTNDAELVAEAVGLIEPAATQPSSRPISDALQKITDATDATDAETLKSLAGQSAKIKGRVAAIFPTRARTAFTVLFEPAESAAVAWIPMSGNAGVDDAFLGRLMHGEVVVSGKMAVLGPKLMFKGRPQVTVGGIDDFQWIAPDGSVSPAATQPAARP